MVDWQCKLPILISKMVDFRMTKNNLRKGPNYEDETKIGLAFFNYKLFMDSGFLDME